MLNRRATQAGFSMIEVLISIVIIALGVLGLAGLQARAITAEFESYQRSQAIILAENMVDRMRMSRAYKGDFKNISNASTGAGYLGTSGASSYTLSCPTTVTAATVREVTSDLCEWSQLLEGSGETKAGSKVGAMSGARGCIFYDASTELTSAAGGTIADSGFFTVAVIWQGMTDTVAPTMPDPASPGSYKAVNCGNGLYGSEAKRRAVTTSFRFGYLSN